MTLRAAIALAAGLALGACASHPMLGNGDPQLRRTIVLEALGQIGRPYHFGGADNEGFDCSGLVQYVFAQAGVQMPRTAKLQHDIGKPVDIADAESGDLLFYRVSGGIDHVAIYLGDGRAVHAAGSGRNIFVTSIDQPYWKEKLVDAVRVLR